MPYRGRDCRHWWNIQLVAHLFCIIGIIIIIAHTHTFSFILLSLCSSIYKLNIEYNCTFFFLLLHLFVVLSQLNVYCILFMLLCYYYVYYLVHIGNVLGKITKCFSCLLRDHYVTCVVCMRVCAYGRHYLLFSLVSL